MTAADLIAARKADSNARRQRVLAALAQLKRERATITHAAVARAAHVGTNFIRSHRDLHDLVEEAKQPSVSMSRSAANLISTESLRTDLALSQQRVAELTAKVAALERQFRQAGMTQHALGDHEPELVAARRRVADLEATVTQMRRELADAAEELNAAREANRELARQIMHVVD